MVFSGILATSSVASSPPARLGFFPNEGALMQPVLDDLIAWGVIRRVTKGSWWFSSRLFVMPKPHGEYWLIIDLKRLNKCLRVPAFRIELFCGWHRHQVSLCGPSQSIYRTHIFTSPSTLVSLYCPWEFSRVIKPIKALFHAHGVQLHFYLNDFLILAKGSDLVEFQCHQCIWDPQPVGFLGQFPKIPDGSQSGHHFLGCPVQFGIPHSRPSKGKTGWLVRPGPVMANQVGGFQASVESPWWVLSNLLLCICPWVTQLALIILWMNHRTSTTSRDLQVLPKNGFCGSAAMGQLSLSLCQGSYLPARFVDLSDDRRFSFGLGGLSFQRDS